jgi:hypothetical protein
MAKEHGVRKGVLSSGGDDVADGEVLTPLYELGEKGGNSESPAPDDFEHFNSVPDPLGLLKNLGGSKGK